MSRYDEALAACDQGIRLDPFDVFLCKDKAELLVQVGQDEDALVVFDQFIERTPESFEGYTWKLHFLAEHKRYADGLAAEEAFRLEPQDEDILLEQARTLGSLKRFDEALAVCERAIQLAPEKPSVYKRKGDLMTRQKRHEDALHAYQQAVHFAPEDAFAYEQVGDTLCERERFADAVKAYDRALRLRPTFGRVYSSKADALEKLGRYEQALNAYNKALELKASPLFGPVCLLVREKREWSGTPKQFKETLCSQSPDAFARWYRAPQKFVEELKKITPALQDEGIAVGVPPENTLGTLTGTLIEGPEQPG